MFSGRFGTCFDDIIEEELNCFVPKNKSYLTQKDLTARMKKPPPKTEKKADLDLVLHQSPAEILGE